MYFIADHCGKEYEDLIKEEVPFKYEIEFTALGINGTALRQYDLAAQTVEDEILFQECDYLYRPSVGSQMVDAIKHFRLLSPYDHPNFYIDKSIHSSTCDVELYNNQHYRTTERNTMTFGMTRYAFLESYEILKKYGYLDNEVWKELKEIGYPLRVPIPSYATHMARDWMAPAIPWDLVQKIYI